MKRVTCIVSFLSLIHLILGCTEESPKRIETSEKDFQAKKDTITPSTELREKVNKEHEIYNDSIRICGHLVFFHSQRSLFVGENTSIEISESIEKEIYSYHELNREDVRCLYECYLKDTSQFDLAQGLDVLARGFENDHIFQLALYDFP